MAAASTLRNHPTKLAIAAAATTLVLALRARRSAQPVPSPVIPREASAAIPGQGAKRKVAVDAHFFGQLTRLMRVIIPSPWCKEFFLVVLHTFFLVSRTFLSLYIVELEGDITKTIVQRDMRGFLTTLAIWIGISLPSTFVNSMIQYFESTMAVAFRSRLIDVLYKQYMGNQVFYRVGNLDTRISNVDQSLTEDVARFCNSVAHIYSHLSKPSLDIVLMSSQLFLMARKKAGAKNSVLPLVLAGGVIGLTAKLLRTFSPPFGKLLSHQAQFEGNLRATHSRIIVNAEEIAFYRGEKVELEGLLDRYRRLIQQMKLLFRARIGYTTLEGFLMKYLWSACGMVMIAIPAFSQDASEIAAENNEVENVGNRTRDFVTSKNLLVKGADAVERVLSAYKEINELAGYTARVHDLITVFSDMENEKYMRSGAVANSTGNSVPLMSQRGVVHEADYISAHQVPIVSPTGDVLVKAISFDIQPNQHLLITGPNGCGKSSLFRIIGGLWPVTGGILYRPPKGKIFYIPQRPFLTPGTFRDQIIFPDTVEDMKRKGFTDEKMMEILKWVHLVHILEREGGWDAKKEWPDVLSGGEKQRVGFARVFYHLPRFAILDECTSAVSIDVEGQMYNKALELGITLMTVTHRPTLWRYHTHLLQFDGQGGWAFSPLSADVRLSLKDEKTRLEGDLANVKQKQERLKELCQLLGEESVVLRNVVESKTEGDESNQPDSPQSK